MNHKTEICYRCQKPHALFYYQRKSGKQVLGYWCSSQPNIATIRGEEVYREHHAFVQAKEQVDGLELPVVMTPAAKKLARDKNQIGIFLEELAPGTARPDVTIAPAVDDAAEVERRMVEAMQQAGQIEAEIRTLESKANKLRAKARQLSANASELRTFKLFGDDAGKQVAI